MTGTQDTLADGETVVDELEDGSRLVEVSDGVDTWYRLELTESTVPLENMSEDDASLAWDVYQVVDGYTVPSDRGAIPLSVAKADRRVLASYLSSVEGWDTERIADELGVQRRSVWDYTSQLRARARDQGDP